MSQNSTLCGPCGVNLDDFNTVIITQQDECKKKCCKKGCTCKVLVFNVTSTGSTGSVASSNSTFVEQYDPSPLQENLIFNPNFIPNELQSNKSSDKANIWINSLTGKIYKLFPNGYWYLQGDLRKRYNDIFSVVCEEKQSITSEDNYLPPTLLRTGFSPKDGSYSVNLKLQFEQDKKSNNIIKVEVLDYDKVLDSSIKSFDSVVDSISLPMILNLKETSNLNIKITTLYKQYQVNNLWISNFKLEGFLIN